MDIYRNYYEKEIKYLQNRIDYFCAQKEVLGEKHAERFTRLIEQYTIKIEEEKIKYNAKVEEMVAQRNDH